MITIKSNTMAPLIRFETLGKHFGYPTCCVDWFLGRFSGANPFGLTHEQEAIDNNEGFIPCPKCAEKVYNGELEIEDLITDRAHPLKYPEVDREYIDAHYE